MAGFINSENEVKDISIAFIINNLSLYLNVVLIFFLISVIEEVIIKNWQYFIIMFSMPWELEKKSFAETKTDDTYCNFFSWDLMMALLS